MENLNSIQEEGQAPRSTQHRGSMGLNVLFYDDDRCVSLVPFGHSEVLNHPFVSVMSHQ